MRYIELLVLLPLLGCACAGPARPHRENWGAGFIVPDVLPDLEEEVARRWSIMVVLWKTNCAGGALRSGDRITVSDDFTYDHCDLGLLTLERSDGSVVAWNVSPTTEEQTRICAALRDYLRSRERYDQLLTELLAYQTDGKQPAHGYRARLRAGSTGKHQIVVECLESSTWPDSRPGL